MRVYPTVLIVAMFFVAALPISSPPSLAETNFIVETFGNGQRSVTVNFPMAGMDDTSSLSLQTGLSIDDASMSISTVQAPPGSTDYPTNVSVDFGGDRMPEWQWNGPGIGSFGNQNVFTSGEKSQTLKFSPGGNQTSYFYMPKNAKVLSANCTVKSAGGSGLGTVILTGGTSSNNFPFNQAAFRYHFLYIASELGTSGILDKISWRNPSTTLTPATFTNLKILCCNTPVASLTTTFASNYGGNTPVKVIDTPSWTINDYPGGYYEFDVSNDFYYDNTQNLVIEVSLTAKSGGTVYVANFAAVGQRRAYLSGSADGATAGGTDTGRADAKFEFLTKTDMTVDACNDAKIDYTNPSDNYNDSQVVFTQGLIDFMAKAPPVSFTDAYGNDFVKVPMTLSMLYGGMGTISNLNVIYEYQTPVGKNPVTGDIASSLDDLQSSKPGNYNTSIPILVSSSSAGRLMLTDLRISMHAPSHKPSITSFFPAAETVVKENSVLELGVNATDWYGLPLKYMWFYNDIEVTGAQGDRLSLPFGFEDAGIYAVKIVVSNDNGSAQQSWNVVVQNVNRPPEISGSAPTSDPNILEGSDLEFTVNASDPDDDPIGYVWMLDGKGQGAASDNSFIYRTDFFSAGKHVVKVVAMDPGSLKAEHEWAVLVGNVDQAPQITDWEPKDDPTMIENQECVFGVTPADADNGVLTTSWTLDGTPQVTGNAYHFVTDYRSAGVHTVKATVSDGDLAAVHVWQVTVLNLNRPPKAVIDSPRDMIETMQGPALHFSANSSSDPDGEQLSYAWKEGGAVLSDRAVFDMPFTHGFHTVVLEVRDRSGAASEATVHFRVRWVEFSLVLGFDKLDVSGGEKVGIIVTLRNVGDTDAKDQKLEILVDGKPIAGEDLPALAAGESAKAQFEWKATKGAHTITARMGDQTWNTPITVAGAKPAAAGASVNGYLWPVLLIVVAAGLVIWGRSALRRK